LTHPRPPARRIPRQASQGMYPEKRERKARLKEHKKYTREGEQKRRREERELHRVPTDC